MRGPGMKTYYFRRGGAPAVPDKAQLPRGVQPLCGVDANIAHPLTRVGVHILASRRTRNLH
eukprot:3420934-Pyramimonas_sp.AAC.1